MERKAEHSLGHGGFRKTFFGLEVVCHGETSFVRADDVLKLPFYEFWIESMAGSTMQEVNGVDLVYLHDWESFAREFIATGKHRYSSQSSDAEN